MPSIFDSIHNDDLILAFFPCVRFSVQSYMMYRGTSSHLKNSSDLKKIENVMKYHKELSFFYDMICKLFYICLDKNFSLIVENPYSPIHYLTRYFPIQPKLIDIDRRTRGDNFKKPTQYWFINIEPKFNFIFEPVSFVESKTIANTHNKVERSLINSNYASRFIREFIL